MTTTSRALVVFETEGTHPLSRLLHRWRHVWCIVEEPDSCVWIGHNWLAGRIELSYQGTEVQDVIRHHNERGATVIPTTVDLAPVERPYWPLVVHNCVGMTKRALRLDSWAQTPFALYRHLMQKDQKLMFTHWLTVPGKSLISPSKPKAPEPPPPPPTMVDAEVSASRRRARRAAMGATGQAGQTRNIGGALGVSTGSASTTSSTLLGG